MDLPKPFEMTAKYAGKCAICPVEFKEGDRFYYRCGVQNFKRSATFCCSCGKSLLKAYRAKEQRNIRYPRKHKSKHQTNIQIQPLRNPVLLNVNGVRYIAFEVQR